MLNMTYIIRVLGIVSILGVIIQSNCYAKFKTTMLEISVNCSPSREEAKPIAYAGAPDTYLGLATKGIRIDGGEEELITPKNWDWNNNAFVIARCTVSDGVTNAKMMFSYFGRDLDTLPTLECHQGEGIEIVMYQPNDPDSNKYRYVADLITDRIVRKKVPSSEIPSSLPFVSGLESILH